MKTGRVIKSHRSDFPTPIKFKAGDRLASCVERKTEWEGWRFCRTIDDIEGWVPREYLSVNDSIWRAACDYDATELAVDIGQELVILKETAGWFWCRAGERLGWVPVENVTVD